VVYRCLNSCDIPEGVGFLDDKAIIGASFTDRGFVCTSYVDGIDNLPPTFYHGRDTVLEIYAPAGSRGVNVESISAMGSSEKEITFDCGQVYKVDSVRYEKGKRIIRVKTIQK